MQKPEVTNKDIRHLLLPVGIIAIVLCGTTFLPCSRSHEIHFHDGGVGTYDDRAEKQFPGNSEILLINEQSTELKVRYILKPGFTYPYAGILISLRDRNGNCLDCSRFDVLKIRIASSQLSDCKIYLTVFDKNVSKDNTPLSERYLKKDLLLNPSPEMVSIHLKQLTTPEWWFQKNNITLKDVAPVDFSKVTALKIESGSTAKTGIIDTLTISQIRFAKKPNKYTLFLLFILPLPVIGRMVLRLPPRRKNEPVIITYDKKEVRSYRDINVERISDYLAEHFSDIGLTIISMGRSLGLSQKKIARIMNDEFKMSFKQYLTSIRIHEAKRLLLETDRQVSDVSLSVGFNSISHFNRVFKAATLVTPLEFRNTTNPTFRS